MARTGKKITIIAFNTDGGSVKENVSAYIFYSDNTLSEADVATKIPQGQSVKVNILALAKDATAIRFCWTEKVKGVVWKRYCQFDRDSSYVTTPWNGGIITWNQYSATVNGVENIYLGSFGGVGNIAYLGKVLKQADSEASTSLSLPATVNGATKEFAWSKPWKILLDNGKVAGIFSDITAKLNRLHNGGMRLTITFHFEAGGWHQALSSIPLGTGFAVEFLNLKGKKLQGFDCGLDETGLVINCGCADQDYSGSSTKKLFDCFDDTDTINLVCLKRTYQPC